MKVLASYIMRGRMSAMTVTAAAAALSMLLMPLSFPLSYLSAAAVVMVTLAQGPKEGLLNVLGAVLSIGVLATLMAGSPMLALGFALLVWLPAWLMGYVLHQSGSLGMALLSAGAIGVAAVLGTYMAVPDPAAWWHSYFTEQVLPIMGLSAEDAAAAELDEHLMQLSQLMTGLMAAFLTLGMGVSLLLGRWWQALVYRPGGFGEEFARLRLGVWGAWAAVVAVVAVMGPDGIAEVAGNVLAVLVVLFLFQGLALAHVLLARLGAHKLWLVGLYVLLLMIPQFLLLLSAAGCVDNWFDFRARLQKPA